MTQHKSSLEIIEEWKEKCSTFLTQSDDGLASTMMRLLEASSLILKGTDHSRVQRALALLEYERSINMLSENIEVSSIRTIMYGVLQSVHGTFLDMMALKDSMLSEALHAEEIPISSQSLLLKPIEETVVGLQLIPTDDQIPAEDLMAFKEEDVMGYDDAISKFTPPFLIETKLNDIKEEEMMDFVIPNNNEFPMERKEELVNEFHDFPDDNQMYDEIDPILGGYNNDITSGLQKLNGISESNVTIVIPPFLIEPKEEQKEIKEEEMMDDFVIPNYYEFPMKPKEESVDLFQEYSDNNSIGGEDILEDNSIETEGAEGENSVGQSKNIKKKKKSSSNKQELARKKLRKEKRNSTELECPECEYHTRSVQAWVQHLRQSHSTSPTLAGVALLCQCGNESLSAAHKFYCDIAEFKVIRKRDGPIQRISDTKTTPQCVQCKVFPKTITAYPQHLHRHHNSTLNMLGIYLKCSCGIDIHSRRESFLKEHANKCDSCQFTLHKLEEN